MATKKSTGTAEKKASAKTAAKAPAKTPATAAAEKTPAPKAASKNAAAPEKKAPTHHDIAQLAHQYWVERGHGHGSHEADWFRAEQKLKGQ
jgi:hypothetical protein